MVKLVLTAIGDDREGLVQAISTELDRLSGNWLESQFARLAGKFAGVALVELPEQNTSAFADAMSRLETAVGLRVEVTPGVAETEAASQTTGSADGPLRLHLIGQDRPGTVRQVTSALVAQHVTIAEFSSWTTNAPEGGGLLFEAEAVIHLPENGDPASVRAALEEIATELMVDLELS